jgi:type I restriction enzyme S subunit
MKDSGIEWIGKIPVGWKIAPLKRLLATPIADGPHVTPNFLNEGIPFVSVEAAFDGRIHLECRRGFISREDHELYCQKLRPQRNDIFIVKSGSTTGKIILIDIDEEFSVWSPLALVRCLKSHSYKFIYYSLTSKYFQSEIWTNLSMGTQPNIGMGVLENLSVPLPSLSEQQAIADYLDKKCASVDESIKQSRALIEELGEYKKSLIYEVVTGKREV